MVVNSAMIMTYYEIGTIINQRKIWGNKYIERLSNDLKEYGKGYSADNLFRVAQFAKEFSKIEIMEQPVPKIPWVPSVLTLGIDPYTCHMTVVENEKEPDRQ